MKRQKLIVGQPLKIIVRWIDRVPEPPREVAYDGEVIGWRNSQVIVRVKEYAVLRFWKDTGIEVGNGDHVRRGFTVNLHELDESVKPPPGIDIGLDIPLAIDTDA